MNSKLHPKPLFIHQPKSNPKPIPTPMKNIATKPKPIPIATRPSHIATRPSPVATRPSPVITKPSPVVTKPGFSISKPTPISTNAKALPIPNSYTPVGKLHSVVAKLNSKPNVIVSRSPRKSLANVMDDQSHRTPPISCLKEVKSEGGGEAKGGGGEWVVGGRRLAHVWRSNSVAEVSEFLRVLGGAWGGDGDVMDKVLWDVFPREKVHFTYGEVLPSGVRLLLRNLGAESATTLFDWGCGKGRLVIQAFFEYPNLQRVVGLELSASRFAFAKTMLHTLVQQNSFQLKIAADEPNKIVVHCGKRVLEIRCQDLFTCKDANESDIIICETSLPTERKGEFIHHLTQTLRRGARFLLYHRLSHFAHTLPYHYSFTQAGVGVKPQRLNFTDKSYQTVATVELVAPLDQRYPTSWEPALGAQFDLWKRIY